MSKIVVVIPTVRPECHEKFVEAWTPLFKKHRVTLITVWDGENPSVSHHEFWEDGIYDKLSNVFDYYPTMYGADRDLFCIRTDACRNLGFVAAAVLQPDYLLTLDDDVVPLKGSYMGQINGKSIEGPEKGCYDPIQAHIDALNRRVPLSWMNTAHDTDLYLRGVPYSVKDEAQVMLSHGVWVGTPDFDGETQLRLEQDTIPCGYEAKSGVPYSLPYYVGPIPRGVLFPLCGMNVMVRKEAIPYLYFAPMGPDSGVEGLNRFADIWMGVQLKREFDRLNWACVTGYSTILHTRASDAKKNFEQEKLGRKWNEWVTERGYPVVPEDVSSFTQFQDYWRSHIEKRERFRVLVTDILGKKGGEV